jgi:hypothetical protein
MELQKYCTVEDVENYSLKDIVDSYEDTVEGFIYTASRIMDNLTGRRLLVPTYSDYEVETQYYDGQNKSKLIIDDNQTITKVEVGDYYGEDMTEIDAETYVITPKTPPRSVLIRKNDIFPIGEQNIAITGTFGMFTELPKDLIWACSVIVTGLINAQAVNSNEVKKSESIDGYSVSYSETKQMDDYVLALETIGKYKKIVF